MVSDHYVEGYRLLLGLNDSLQFLKTIPSNSIKLIVTSPPYNIGKVYEEKVKLNEYLDYQEEIAKECSRILKEDGNLAWEVGNFVYKKEIFPLDFFFYKIFKEDNGFKLRNRIIWRIEHGLHASLRFSGRYETILWFTKTDNYTFNLDPVRVPQKYPGKTYYKGEKRGKPSCNPLGKNPGDVWDIVLQDWEEQIWNIPNVKANHPEKTIHPAQFPIELVQRLILALTNEEDIVLDPFGGVGSSALGALLLNRKAISIDKEKEYIDITLERVKAMINGTLKIRKIGTKIYTPTGREKVSQIPKEWTNNENN
ncbi:DNA-methyltransferase [Fervidicoccus fontis]|uniref:Type II methyltransferase n=1 Tax=Fervidicoccus fontis TaxID=683846 RepID=A0A7C2ZSV7_9CREN|nr:site-specific DNA-methyltransferase [Fervidicoccus fontis]